MKNMFSAGVVVYAKKDDETLYLLLLNAKGHWDFAKGRIEENEGKHEAAQRELQEEAGIAATLYDGFEHEISYFFTDHDGQKAHKTVYYFIGQAESTDVQISHEHSDYVWLPFDEALVKLPFDESKELLKSANTFLTSKN